MLYHLAPTLRENDHIWYVYCWIRSIEVHAWHMFAPIAPIASQQERICPSMAQDVMLLPWLYFPAFYISSGLEHCESRCPPVMADKARVVHFQIAQIEPCSLVPEVYELVSIMIRANDAAASTND